MSRGYTACSTFGFGEDTLTFGLIIFSYFSTSFLLLGLVTVAAVIVCCWSLLCMTIFVSDFKA